MEKSFLCDESSWYMLKWRSMNVNPYGESKKLFITLQLKLQSTRMVWKTWNIKHSFSSERFDFNQFQNLFQQQSAPSHYSFYKIIDCEIIDRNTSQIKRYSRRFIHIKKSWSYWQLRKCNYFLKKILFSNINFLI